MPRIPSRGPVVAPTAPLQQASPADVGPKDRFVVAPKRSFETFFAPYEPALKAEVAALDQLLEARAADPKQYAADENPYRIDYAVYNLRSKAVIERIIRAADMGVQVRVLVESEQIAPERSWNRVDENFEDAGLNVLRDDSQASEAQRDAAHLIGIKSNHLMHMKARVLSWKDPDSGEAKSMVLSGSMNPGDGAAKNDENLNIIRDPAVAAAYRQKVDDVLAHKRTDNVWDEGAPINVLFTPAKSGPRPIEKLFQWIDAEQEQIMINVFDLKDVKEPGSERKLSDALIAAKHRGVDVVVITDRKKSDGRDAEGNRVKMYGHFASNSWFDEDLEKAGIPVYEFQNESGDYNAVHGKAAVFGRSRTRVITGAGNWTRGSIGSGNKKARNEESFIFVDSHALDGNRTGQRYLSNMLYLLRNYDHQNTEHLPAEAMIKSLQDRPGWPSVSVDPARLVPADFDGEAVLSGDYGGLRDGLRWRPGSPIALRGEPIELPFGARITYDLHDRDGQLVGDDLRLILSPKAPELR